MVCEYRRLSGPISSDRNTTTKALEMSLELPVLMCYCSGNPINGSRNALLLLFHQCTSEIMHATRGGGMKLAKEDDCNISYSESFRALGSIQ